MKKYVELFQGLMDGDLAQGGGGYIISARFHPRYNYGVFEVIGFRNVKNINSGDRGVTLHSDGYKSILLYEPVNYPKRFMEPYLRDDVEQIPARWNELETVEMPNRDRLFITLKPYLSQGSFTVESPEEGNFVYYVFEGPDMDRVVEAFVLKALQDDFKVPKRLLESVAVPLRKNLAHFQQNASAD